MRPDVDYFTLSEEQFRHDFGSISSRCEYYKLDDHNNEFNKAKYKNSLSLIALNVQSCNRNFVHFTTFLEKLSVQYDIIILTETFLTAATNFTYEIDGYESFASFKTNKRGGVKIFCRNYLNPVQIDKLCVNDELYESLFVSLCLSNNKKLLAGGIYRSPSGSKADFNRHFENNVLNKLSPGVDCVMGGDFNFNLLNPYNDRQTDEFSDLMFSKSLFPLITRPTHRCPQTLAPKTLIDHVWSTLPVHSEAAIIDYHITHHMATAVLFPDLQAKKMIKITFRDYSVENYNKLAHDIVNILPNLDYDTLSSNELTNMFVTWLHSVQNKYFPIKTKTISLKRLKSPWITDELLSLINKKHQLFNQYKMGHITKLSYNAYKNLLVYTLKFAKQSYYVNCYLSAKNDIAKSWKITSSLLNKNKNSPPIKLVKENQIITDPKEVCNTLATHFHRAPITTREAIPPANNPIQNRHVVQKSLFFTPATSDEVKTIISNFKNKKSSINSVPAKLLKYLAPSISHFIANIFNHSFHSGQYPDCLKIARVVPIYKGGAKDDPKNYRPVSILTNINKVFEKLIHKRINSFLEQNNIISYAQYGFCRGKSTSHATYEVLSKIQPAFTEKMFSICIFADFSKAFDTVDHATLLQKLEDYGIRGPVLAYLKSYLTNRKQYINANNSSSEHMNISYGVPQGSVLGPLFFNIYANEISYLQLNMDVVQYADDTVLMCSGSDLTELVDKANNALQVFYDWCCFNKLALNINKTQYIIFSPAPCPFDPVLTINGTPLEKVKEYKYLGVIIDENLKFDKHITKIKSKLSQLCGVSFKLGRFLSLDAARTFYFSMVQSVISYNIVFWGASSKTLLDALQRKQNIIVRNLFKHHFMESLCTSEVFKAVNVLKISDFHQYSVGLTLFKAMHLNKFPLINDAIISHQWNHSYNTRRVNPFRLPKTRVDPDRNCFLFQALSLYNKLPKELREIVILNSFKRKLSSHLSSEY